MLVIPLNLLKAISWVIWISRLRNVTLKALKFQVTRLKQSKLHKVIVLTKGITPSHL